MVQENEWLTTITFDGHDYRLHRMKHGNWKSWGYLAALKPDDRDRALKLSSKKLNDFLGQVRSALKKADK